MRRLFLLLSFAILTVVANAQDASISEFFGAELKFYAEQFDGQDYLILSFKSTDDCIPLESSEMKIEFFNGEIVKLDGYNVRTQSKTSSVYGGGWSYSSEKLIIALRFDLTKEIVNYFESGIKQISIYTVPKVFRKKYEKDKLGQKIYKAFKEQESLF